MNWKMRVLSFIHMLKDLAMCITCSIFLFMDSTFMQNCRFVGFGLLCVSV